LGLRHGWYFSAQDARACHHRVRSTTKEEQEIFQGRTFSKLTKQQLREYLTYQSTEWDDDWKCDKLYEVARERWDTAAPAICELAAKYKHKVMFLPPYHSDLNPIENIWGIVKGYVARNRKEFNMKEVLQLTKAGVAHVTSEMWKKAVARVERIETEMFIDDVLEEINI